MNIKFFLHSLLAVFLLCLILENVWVYQSLVMRQVDLSGPQTIDRQLHVETDFASLSIDAEGKPLSVESPFRRTSIRELIKHKPTKQRLMNTDSRSRPILDTSVPQHKIRASSISSSKTSENELVQFLILPSENPCSSRDVELLIFVPSRPEEADRRQAIRQTWGSHRITSHHGHGGATYHGVSDEDVKIQMKDTKGSKKASDNVNIELHNHRKNKTTEQVTKSRQNNSHSSNGINKHQFKLNEGRTTYDSLVTKTVLLFIIGLAKTQSEQHFIETEARHDHDIVQINFIDSYVNLTLKSKSMLEWFWKYCRQAHYVAKIDNDMYANVHLLTRVLRNTSNDFLANRFISSLSNSYSLSSIWKSFESESNQPLRQFLPYNRTPTEPAFIIGYLYHRPKVNRNKLSKWYTPYSAYRGRYYPDYIAGPAYAMSGVAAARLYAASLRIPSFPLEDVFITGMCAQEAGVPRLAAPSFDFQRPRVSGCWFQRRVVGHALSPGQMRQVHREITDPRLRC